MFKNKTIVTGSLLVCAALTTLLISPSADAKRFRVKNCTALESVEVRSYNGSDSTMIAHHNAKDVKKGETAKLKCDSNRCRFQVMNTNFTNRVSKIGKKKWLVLDRTRHINLANYYYARVLSSEPSC